MHKSVFEWPNSGLILILDETLSNLEIGLDHLLDESVKVDLALPPKKALSLGGVTQEQPWGNHQYLLHGLLERDVLDFSRAEVSWVNLDNGLSALDVNTLFLNASALPATKERDQYSVGRSRDQVILTGSGFQECQRTFRQTRGRDGFRQWRGRNHQERPAGASSTYPRRNHELAKNQNGVLRYTMPMD